MALRVQHIDFNQLRQNRAAGAILVNDQRAGDIANLRLEIIELSRIENIGTNLEFSG